MTSHRIRCLAALAVLASAACSVGNNQLPPSDIPREFRSSAGGGLIEHVLMLPMYEVLTGISTKGGHGPGEMTSRYVIAAPFRYRPGDRFVIPVPDAQGLGLPPLFFAGRSTMLRGVAVIAREHRPLWMGDLWSDRVERVLTLDRMSSDEWRAPAERLRALVETGNLKTRTEDESWLNVIAGEDVSLQLTARERAMILELLTAPGLVR
jgi:hypothetical protein